MRITEFESSKSQDNYFRTFNKWGNWGPESLTQEVKVPQLVSSRGGLEWMPAVWLSWYRGSAPERLIIYHVCWHKFLRNFSSRVIIADSYLGKKEKNFSNNTENLKIIKLNQAHRLLWCRTSQGLYYLVPHVNVKETMVSSVFQTFLIIEFFSFLKRFMGKCSMNTFWGM